MRHFTDTYERNNFTVTAGAVGMRATIDTDGSVWKAITAGTGAANWQPVAYSEIPIPLNAWRLCSSGSDVGNIAAIGGVGASDTAPILRGDAQGDQEFHWIADGVVALCTDISLPDDFDAGQDAILDLLTSSGGTTNAATFGVSTTWDGGTAVSDTATGTAATARGAAQATIAAADIPASPKKVSIRITPAAHAADTMSLHRSRLLYFHEAP